MNENKDVVATDMPLGTQVELVSWEPNTDTATLRLSRHTLSDITDIVESVAASWGAQNEVAAGHTFEEVRALAARLMAVRRSTL